MPLKIRCQSYIKKEFADGIRNQNGEMNPATHLSQKDVEHIRNLYKNTNMTHLDLATKFTVSRKTIGNIVNNICWHDDNYIIPKRNKKDKLSIEQAEEIRKLYTTGKYTYFKLAKKYGVCFQGIGDIIHHKTWRK